jgi:two-component system sensor histidine kinase YesM
VKKKSLKNKIFIYLLFPLIACIALLVFYNFYSIYVYNKEIEESTVVMQELYINNLEDYLTKTDNFLTGIAVNNDNFAALRTKQTQLQAHLAITTINDICEVQMNNVSFTGGFFLYSLNNGIYRNVFQQSYTYAQMDQIRKYLMERVRDGGNYAPLGWFYAKVGSYDYLFRIIGEKGTYVMSFIEFKDIPLPMSNKFINNYEVVYRLNSTEVITNREFVDRNGILFRNDQKSYYVSGNNSEYVLIGSSIKGTDIEMYFVKLNKGLLGGLKTMQIILLICTILSLLMIPNSLFLISRTIVRPINQLKAVMEQIKKGDMDTQIDKEFELEEFGEVNETFNSMIAKIKDLKIQYYEQKLEKQKAQLQYLQLQIKPHFFLNCLKNIYGMAQNKKYDKIQDMVLIISEHLRYIFKDNNKLVSVNQELSYIKNYMMLQEMGVVDPPHCTLDVDAEATDKRIPPLVIQTFVENSMKYGVIMGQQLEVQIKIKLLNTESGEYLDISINDNGQGYPEQVLEYLNKEESSMFFEEHIGIFNVINRLRMIYADKAEFVFMNQERGAFSELIIPC